jgi:hypothetical protein
MAGDKVLLITGIATESKQLYGNLIDHFAMNIIQP